MWKWTSIRLVTVNTNIVCKESQVRYPKASGFCYRVVLVNFVLNLPDGQVLCFGEIQITEGL